MADEKPPDGVATITKHRGAANLKRPKKGGPSPNPAGMSKEAAAFKMLKQKAFREKVTPEEFDQVLDGLLSAAKDGDAACIRLVLDHTVGPIVDTKIQNTTNILNLLPPARAVDRPTVEAWRADATRLIEAKK